MISAMRFSIGVVLLLTAAVAGGAELAIDLCGELAPGWAVILGREFPGAAGQLAINRENAARRIAFDYDFTKGGAYVSAGCPLPGNPAIKEVVVRVTPKTDCMGALRGVDSTGRSFLQISRRLAAGATVDLTLKTAGPWGGQWGGKESPQGPTLPWRRVWLTINKDQATPVKGTVCFEKVTAIGDKLTKPDFAADSFKMQGGAYVISGDWSFTASGATLVVNGEIPAGESVELSCDFPDGCGNLVKRLTLNRDNLPEMISFPVTNPRNRYVIKLTAVLSDGNTVSRDVVVRGGKYAAVDFADAPRTSKDIKNVRFGVCTHFGYRNQAWSDYRARIDEIVQCGFSIIREDIPLEKKDDGKWHMRDYDLEWVGYARSRGLHVLPIIPMHVSITPEEFAERCEGLANDGKSYFKHYEFGNEPPGGGEYMKTLGGTWNGRESDGKDSPWIIPLVKTFNAGARAIKKVQPDAVLIGAGAVSSANVRIIAAGLSTLFSGIADHPYGYSLQAEKVPWGDSEGFKKRDGLVVGDTKCDFRGFVKSYGNHFVRLKRSDLSLWLTEYGFSSFRFSGKNEKNIYAGYTEEAQAIYTLRRSLMTLGLPLVKGSFVYDYCSDFNDPYGAESHFGMLRYDFSKKPVWYAMQRFNRLLAEAEPDKSFQVKLDSAPLHPAAMKQWNARKWSDTEITPPDELSLECVVNPATSRQMVIVWNSHLCGRELNNRAAALTITGWKRASLPLVALDLITGRSFDLPAEWQSDGSIKIPKLELDDNPVAIIRQ
ncbi:MAG: hypothetical protein PHI35_01535 [Victivallaceae bacterium]|nr:hypothetical protein [Victivallaceae bacterium]